MTLAQWRKYAAPRLRAAGDLDAETDSCLFLCAVLGVERPLLRFRAEEELDEEALKALETMLLRRESGEPEQYIEGAAYFMGLKLKIDSRALIPRSDTETLCEAAIAEIKTAPQPRVLDMCTGSGCIAVSVAKYCPRAAVTACDISAEALALAEENALINGVRLECVQSDGFLNLEGRRFDALLCNPPYLTGQDMAQLQREVAHEPRLALYGGEDGLAFYRRFAREMKEHLNASALVLFEVGAGQSSDVCALMQRAYPESKTDTIKDLNGVERVVRMRT